MFTEGPFSFQIGFHFIGSCLCRNYNLTWAAMRAHKFDCILQGTKQEGYTFSVSLYILNLVSHFILDLVSRLIETCLRRIT